MFHQWNGQSPKSNLRAISILIFHHTAVFLLVTHCCGGAVSSPFIVSIDRTSSGVILQCESAGWYPEPEVFWLDGEGKLFSVGPTETVRGPDDLYTVSSRVTVEKRRSNNYTCRVQQQNINQTRETQIRILEDVFMAPSSSVVRIIVFLSVCFLLFSAFFLVFWKLSQNKGPNKMHHDNETEDGTGEREQLVRGSTKMKDLDEEKLQEKEKELNDMIHVISVLMEQKKEKEKEQNDMIQVISVLMEQKKELENSRDEHMSQLEKVEEEWRKNKKPKPLKSKQKRNKGDKKNMLSEGKPELENRKTEYQESLQNIVERLQKTLDAITTITEWKKIGENHIEQIKKQLDETKRQRDEIQSEQLERQEETNILIHQHLDELKTDSPQSIETQSDSDITIPVQQSSSGQNTATAHSGVRQQTD